MRQNKLWIDRLLLLLSPHVGKGWDRTRGVEEDLNPSHTIWIFFFFIHIHLRRQLEVHPKRLSSKQTGYSFFLPSCWQGWDGVRGGCSDGAWDPLLLTRQHKLHPWAVPSSTLPQFPLCRCHEDCHLHLQGLDTDECEWAWLMVLVLFHPEGDGKINLKKKLKMCVSMNDLVCMSSHDQR